MRRPLQERHLSLKSRSPLSSAASARFASALLVSGFALSQAQAQTVDNFNGGFRSDLAWSLQSPGANGTPVGTYDPAYLSFTGTELVLDPRSQTSLYGANNVPIDLPNLTVTSVPSSWFVETSVQANYADLTNRTRFTQADLHIYRDVDYFFSFTYGNVPNAATPQSQFSTNVQTKANNSTYGGYSTVGFASNNNLQARMRIERKATGTVSDFVLGGTSSGIFIGINTGSGWQTIGEVSSSGNAQQQLAYAVLSQVTTGYHIGLSAADAPTPDTVVSARFDYIATNLGVAAAPEPGALALLVLPFISTAVVRRRSHV